MDAEARPERSYTPADAVAATERVRAVALQLPEMTERRSHGFATFFVRDKRSVCYVSDDHHGDGRLALIAAAPDGAQEELVRSEPDRYYRPPYVSHRGWIGLRLDVDPDWGEVTQVIETAYRQVAPKTLVRRLDAAGEDG